MDECESDVSGKKKKKSVKKKSDCRLMDAINVSVTDSFRAAYSQRPTTTTVINAAACDLV